MEKLLFWLDLSIVFIESSLIFWAMKSFYRTRFDLVLSFFAYLSLMVITWILTPFLPWILKGTASFVVLIVLGIVFFQGKTLSKIGATALLLMVVLVIDVAMLFVATRMGHSNITERNVVHFVWSVAARMICIALIGSFVLVYKMKLIIGKIQWSSVIGLALIPILVAVMIIYIFVPIESDEVLIFWFSSFLSFMVSIGLLHIQIKNIRMTEYENRALYAKRQIELQKKNYENMNNMRMEANKLHHDMRHHIETAKALYLTGNEQAGKEYIEDLEKRMDEQIAVDEYSNVVLETLLKEYKIKAEQEGIQVKIHAKICMELEMDLFDLSIIIGNTFQNAIEACKKIRDPAVNKNIFCSICMDNHNLMYRISNPIGEKVKKEGKRYITNKADHLAHGIGLISVEQTVEKYFGLMEINAENGEFQVSVTLQNR